MKKVIKSFFIVMMVSILLVVGIFFEMLHNESKILQSIQKVDDYGLVIFWKLGHRVMLS